MRTARAVVLRGLLGLLGLLLGAALLQPAYADDDRRVQDSTRELEQVRGKIRKLAEQVERDHRKRDSMSQALKTAELQIGELLASLSKVQDDIAREQRAIERAQSERATARGDIERQRAVLGQQIRAAYRIGRQGRTKLLLNQQDPVAVGRVLTYYDYLARARKARIDSFVEEIQALRKIEQTLANKLDRLAALEADRRTALSAVERGRVQRQSALARLEGRLTDQQQMLGQLQADESRLEALLDSLRDVLADIPVTLDRGKPIAQRRGQLGWPVRGKLLAGYGQRKAGALRWKGVWVEADAGTPVKAVAAGRVAYLGWLHRFGLLAIVEHDDGWYSLYGHAQSGYKQIGEWVREGEPVVAAGNSGGHAQAGVYFELRRGKRPVDPVAWLARR